MNRRNLLAGILATATFPGLVRTGSIMRIDPRIIAAEPPPLDPSVKKAFEAFLRNEVKKLEEVVDFGGQKFFLRPATQHEIDAEMLGRGVKFSREAIDQIWRLH